MVDAVAFVVFVAPTRTCERKLSSPTEPPPPRTFPLNMESSIGFDAIELATSQRWLADQRGVARWSGEGCGLAEHKKCQCACGRFASPIASTHTRRHGGYTRRFDSLCRKDYVRALFCACSAHLSQSKLESNFSEGNLTDFYEPAPFCPSVLLPKPSCSILVDCSTKYQPHTYACVVNVGERHAPLTQLHALGVEALLRHHAPHHGGLLVYTVLRERLCAWTPRVNPP
jgi:hypothetical protein